MKAISLWQPWASAVALGLKRNETRKWRTDHRGPLAIHAAGKINRNLREFFDYIMRTIPEVSAAFNAAGLTTFDALPKSAVVAVVDVEELISSDAAIRTHQAEGTELLLGDYTENRWVWKTSNLRSLAVPYYVPGRQGFFNVPEFP